MMSYEKISQNITIIRFADEDSDDDDVDVMGSTLVDLLVVNLDHRDAGEKISGMLDVYFVI